MAERLRSIGRKLRESGAVKIKLPEKRVDGFYVSPAWRGLMQEIIAERGRRCQDPDHDPTRPRTGVRIFGDHIREMRDAPHLALDKGNILLRCGSCHTRKTTAERARRLHSRE